MNTNPEIEIFRAGDYGERGIYTEDDLEAIACGYNPALHEAPVTLDHAQSGPALGWVEALRRAGGSLFARLRGVGSSLLGLLREGSYKKRSVELYPQFAETGKPYLRAVSFLGAAVPQVKGMADPQLDANSAGTAEAAQPQAAQHEPALAFMDVALPHVAIDLPGAADSTPPPASPDLAAPAAADPTQRFAELATRLRAAGRWQPAWEVRGIARFFAVLPAAPAVCFAEGEPPLDAAAWFESFLQALPPAVSLGESVAFAEQHAPAPLAALRVTPGGRVDPHSLALDTAARARMTAHPGETYAQALARCAAY